MALELLGAYSSVCHFQLKEHKVKLLRLFSDCCSVLQVADLEISLMMIQNNGVCMLTLLEVLEGCLSSFLFDDDR